MMHAPSNGDGVGLDSRFGNVLIFGINYAPELTGIAVPTTWLAEELSRGGARVQLVAGVPHYPTWRKGHASRRECRNGVDVRRRSHYVPKRMTALGRGAYEVSWTLAATGDAIRSQRPDVVLGVTPSLGGAALAIAAGRRYRVPVGLVVQDIVGRAASQTGLAGGSLTVGVERVEQALARRATRVAIVAESFRSYFVEGGVGTDAIDRVRNPYALPKATKRDRLALRTRLGWAQKFVVLYSGSIGFKHSLECVLRTAELVDGRENLHFVIQGEGSMRRALEVRASVLDLKNVEFRPLVPSAELSDVLDASDVLLVSQGAGVRHMSFPSKLGAYYAAARPIIVAADAEDEVAQEVRSASAGLVVPPEDPSALLAAIHAVKESRALAERLGAAAVDRYRKTIAPSAVRLDFERFLSALKDSTEPEART